MSSIKQGFRPLRICSTCLRKLAPSSTPTAFAYRSFHSSLQRRATELEQSPSAPSSDATILVQKNQKGSEQEIQPPPPVSVKGSRRRRAAVATSSDLPFEQLPYQCFQEALKVLAEDRAEKVVQIEEYRGRVRRELERLRAAEAAEGHTNALHGLRLKIRNMKQHLEWLKVQADVNDPQVKRRFEDGLGQSLYG